MTLLSASSALACCNKIFSNCGPLAYLLLLIPDKERHGVFAENDVLKELIVLAGDAVSSGEVAPAPHKEEFSVGQMAGRMEIIHAHEISMAKFLGSGGYGEVSRVIHSYYMPI